MPKAPLMEASLRNNTTYLQENEISAQALLDTYVGNTPLMWGVANSSIEFVLSLLDHPETAHVDVISSGIQKNSPLILSLSKGWTHTNTKRGSSNSQKEIAIKLLSKGANIHAKDAHGRTALHYACLHRNLEAIETLIANGASLNSLDNNGLSCLDLCCLGHERALQILRSATSGAENYTFTLGFENFMTQNRFYQSLAALLATKSIRIEESRFREIAENNKNIRDALEPLHTHARNIFNLHVKNGYPSFEHFERSLIDNYVLPLPYVPDPIAMSRVKSLLKLCRNIENAAAKNLDRVPTITTTHENTKENIKILINNALKDPKIRAERNLITRVGIAVMNVLSVFCGGLPLLANYCITGHLFFSHQTRSEKLVCGLLDEVHKPTNDRH